MRINVHPAHWVLGKVARARLQGGPAGMVVNVIWRAQ
jgi:hypothetical protein